VYTISKKSNSSVSHLDVLLGKGNHGFDLRVLLVVAALETTKLNQANEACYSAGTNSDSG